MHDYNTPRGRFALSAEMLGHNRRVLGKALEMNKSGLCSDDQLSAAVAVVSGSIAATKDARLRYQHAQIFERRLTH